MAGAAWAPVESRIKKRVLFVIAADVSGARYVFPPGYSGGLPASRIEELVRRAPAKPTTPEGWIKLAAYNLGYVTVLDPRDADSLDDAMTAARVFFENPTALTASKVGGFVKHEFEEWQHPRGRDGEWIEKGGSVKVFRNPTDTKPVVGRVVNVAPEGILVKPKRGPVFIAQHDQIEAVDEVARLDVPINEPEDSPQTRRVVRTDDKRKSQGQTKSNFIDPDTGETMSKTSIGDVFEKLFEARGADLVNQAFGEHIVPVASMIDPETGKRSSRTTPLDFTIGKHGVELKTLSSRAKSLKTAIKREEVARKNGELVKRKLKPLLLVQVVDQDTGTIKVYKYMRFASISVSKMHLVGEYTFDIDDFRAAKDRIGGGITAGGAWTDVTDEPIEPGDTVVELGADGVPVIYTAKTTTPVDTVGE